MKNIFNLSVGLINGRKRLAFHNYAKPCAIVRYAAKNSSQADSKMTDKEMTQAAKGRGLRPGSNIMAQLLSHSSSVGTA